MSSKYSVAEKLVIAAYRLEENGKRPFTAEDLVVAAWGNFPNAFGLSGYEDKKGHPLHPDSNRVFAEIMGSKPLRKRGWLRKVGKKLYQLTETGQEHARLLLERTGEEDTKKARLSRETQYELQRLLKTKAMTKFLNNLLSEISFYDVCDFWGISPRSTAIEFENRIANLESILEIAELAVKDMQISFGHGGQSFGPDEVSRLRDLHKKLQDKFCEELNTIKARTPKGKNGS